MRRSENYARRDNELAVQWVGAEERKIKWIGDRCRCSCMSGLRGLGGRAENSLRAGKVRDSHYSQLGTRVASGLLLRGRKEQTCLDLPACCSCMCFCSTSGLVVGGKRSTPVLPPTAHYNITHRVDAAPEVLVPSQIHNMLLSSSPSACGKMTPCCGCPE